MRVTLKNNALESQNSRQGIFKPSSTVNGRPSWTSASQAIWYMQNNNKKWHIGALDKIGTTTAGILSEVVDELVDPQNVLSWQYWSDKWTSTDDKNDIIVERINCE